MNRQNKSIILSATALIAAILLVLVWTVLIKSPKSFFTDLGRSDMQTCPPESTYKISGAPPYDRIFASAEKACALGQPNPRIVLFPDNPNNVLLYPLDCKALPYMDNCEITNYNVQDHEITLSNGKKVNVSCDAWWLLQTSEAKCHPMTGFTEEVN